MPGFGVGARVGGGGGSALGFWGSSFGCQASGFGGRGFRVVGRVLGVGSGFGVQVRVLDVRVLFNSNC